MKPPPPLYKKERPQAVLDTWRETNMTKSVKELRLLLLLILVLFALVHYPTVAASKPPAQGTVLPQFHLAVPEDSEARGYLGLSGSGRFTVSDINAPVVVIQIFSRY
jgi:hypothetical protein